MSLAAVVACVSRFRALATRGGGGGELEVRVGRKVDDVRFFPGVSRDVFEQLERDMLDAPSLTPERHWTEIVDYFYTTSDGRRARTRVSFDTDNIELRKEHVLKDGAYSVTLRRPDDDVGEACRVACACEEPLADPPSSCIPTHVRVKQRRRFLDVREGKVVWSYELSKTWSANSRATVEHLQHMTEPTYEVECELVDEGGLYCAQRTDEEVAASLLAKVHSLLGEEGGGGEAALEVVDVKEETSKKKKKRGEEDKDKRDMRDMRDMKNSARKRGERREEDGGRNKRAKEEG